MILHLLFAHRRFLRFVILPSSSVEFWESECVDAGLSWPECPCWGSSMVLISLVGGVGPGSCLFFSELPCSWSAAALEVRFVLMTLWRSACGVGLTSATTSRWLLLASHGISVETVADQQWLHCGAERTCTGFTHMSVLFKQWSCVFCNRQINQVDECIMSTTATAGAGSKVFVIAFEFNNVQVHTMVHQ